MSSLRNRQTLEDICCNLEFKQVVGSLLSTFKPIPESEYDYFKSHMGIQ